MVNEANKEQLVPMVPEVSKEVVVKMESQEQMVSMELKDKLVNKVIVEAVVAEEL